MLFITLTELSQELFPQKDGYEYSLAQILDACFRVWSKKYAEQEVAQWCEDNIALAEDLLWRAGKLTEQAIYRAKEMVRRTKDA